MICQRLSRPSLIQSQRLFLYQNYGASKSFSNTVEERKQENLVTVYYDGKCGLCSREINHYKKIAPNGIFDWQDVTEVSPKRLKSEGLTLSEGLRLLHAKDKNGEVRIGVDAFILIWSQLNRWRFLAKIVSLPGIHHIAGASYNFFANWRFNKLEHCQLAAKEDNKKT